MSIFVIIFAIFAAWVALAVLNHMTLAKTKAARIQSRLNSQLLRFSKDLAATETNSSRKSDIALAIAEAEQMVKATNSTSTYFHPRKSLKQKKAVANRLLRVIEDARSSFSYFQQREIEEIDEAESKTVRAHSSVQARCEHQRDALQVVSSYQDSGGYMHQTVWCRVCLASFRTAYFVPSRRA
jgi:hypothetical protein